MLLLMLLLLLHVSRDPEGDKDGARIREVVVAQFYLLDFHLDSKESWIPIVKTLFASHIPISRRTIIIFLPPSLECEGKP